MWNWFTGGQGRGEANEGGAAGGGDRPGPFHAGNPQLGAMHAFRARMREANNMAGIRPQGWTGQRLDATPAVPNDQFVQFGPCDNPEVVGAIGQEGAVMRSAFRNLDAHGFTGVKAAGNAYTVEDLVVMLMLTSVRVKERRLRKVQLAMEAMVPHLPVGMILNQADAAAELEKVLGDVNEIRSMGWFLDGVRALRVDDPVMVAAWDVAAGAWVDQATVVQKMAFIRRLAQVCSAQVRNSALSVIVLTMLAFSLRGSVTTAKLGRITADLSTTMPGLANAITTGDIQLMWTLFGHYVDDRTMPAVMRRWLGMIPAASVRMRVILAQAAGSGLTQLDLIARAFHEHPEFPWVVIHRMYPDEWVAAGRAIEMVGDNPYFGFRRDLTAVRSTNFRRLGAVAGRLLVAFGDKSLEHYRGFVDDPVHKPMTDQMIAAYVQSRPDANHAEAPFTDEELGNHAAMLRLCAAYPVNAGGHANMAGHPDVQ